MHGYKHRCLYMFAQVPRYSDYWDNSSCSHVSYDSYGESPILYAWDSNKRTSGETSKLELLWLILETKNSVALKDNRTSWAQNRFKLKLRRVPKITTVNKLGHRTFPKADSICAYFFSFLFQPLDVLNFRKFRPRKSKVLIDVLYGEKSSLYAVIFLLYSTLI